MTDNRYVVVEKMSGPTSWTSGSFEAAQRCAEGWNSDKKSKREYSVMALITPEELAEYRALKAMEKAGEGDPMRGQWHKMAALLMFTNEIEEAAFTTSDIEAIDRESLVVVVSEEHSQLVMRLMPKSEIKDFTDQEKE